MTRPLGEIVVERGIATREIVGRALEKQKSHMRQGVFRRLGEVILEECVLAASVVAELLSLQGRAIRVCPTCIAQYNVDDEREKDKLVCTRCLVALAVPEELAGSPVYDDETKSQERKDVSPSIGTTSSARIALELASAARGGSESERVRALVGDRGRRFGPFEILGEISRGGMGIVYKARQPGLDRIVALKVLLSGGDSSHDSVLRFQREARAVSRLRHPNIVGVHDVGVIEGVNYFSMDFIEGLTLDKVVTTESLDHRAVAEIFAKVCDAVHYAHQQGVVHRDLKPRNILVDKRREPTVIDFGIARLQRSVFASGEVGAVTKQGEIMGSPAYLAPEYLRGDVLDYDERCDVWSLGACLYSAVSGRAPHANVDTIRIIRSASNQDAPQIRSIQRNVDRGLATVIMTAIERHRENRYQTAGDLAQDLRRWLAGDEVGGRASPLALWWRRARPKVAVAAGITTSIALVWTTGYYAKEIVRLKEAHDAGPSPDALRSLLGEKSIRLGETLLKAGDGKGAERELTSVLDLLEGPRRAEAFLLRAQARRAQSDEAGAADDERAAALLAGKSK
ncbi:protein kinase [bacterium]|nr:protein kinase [bacterium]